MANSLSKYATAGEARVARKLIREALALGYHVSVNDGYETTVVRSTKERQILDAMCSTGEDVVTLHMPVSRKPVATFWLIYGNAEDGEELIADYTDNETSNRLWAAVYGEAA